MTTGTLLLVNALATVLACLFVALYFNYKKAKQQKAEKTMIEGFNKLGALLNKRNSLIADEIKHFDSWASADIYVDFVKTFLTNEQFISFCKKQNLSEDQILNQFNSAVTDLARVVQAKLNAFALNISEKLKDDLKKLVEDEKNV